MKKLILVQLTFFFCSSDISSRDFGSSSKQGPIEDGAGGKEGSVKAVTLKKDWVRRFNKFADNYFAGDIKQTEHCFKDVYLLHKWEKIQQTVRDIDWQAELTEVKYIDVDTIGSAACVGGGCELF